MEEIVGSGNVADPDAGKFIEAVSILVISHQAVEFASIAGKKEGTKATFPSRAPFVDWDAGTTVRGCRELSRLEAIESGDDDLEGVAPEPVGV